MTKPRPASVEVDGNRLRELRKQRGESLAACAKRCGITFQYLSQIERGERNPSPWTYPRICAAFEVRHEDLLAQPGGTTR